MENTSNSIDYYTMAKEFQRLLYKIKYLQRNMKNDMECWRSQSEPWLMLEMDLTWSINNAPPIIKSDTSLIQIQLRTFKASIHCNYKDEEYYNNYTDEYDYERKVEARNYLNICHSDFLEKVAPYLENIIEKLTFQNKPFILENEDNYSMNESNLTKKLEQLLNQNDSRTSSISKRKDSDSMNEKKGVFIVHGHDNEMKETVARFLDKMGLKPIILHEQVNSGKTIIEKFEHYSDVSYAIVLYSPDDKIEDGKYRARQNVVFEHGFFIGKLGRDKVIGINKPNCNMELQSDLDGVLYISFDSDWKVKLSKEMKEAGLNIDLNNLL